MSDEKRVEHLDVRVEQQSAGWVIIVNVDGEEKQIGDAHASKEEAEKQKDFMFAAADRWADAAKKDAPHPETYPGDQQ
ncbi:hypothetical protein BN1232_05838 [Mycobacterium lentiflavum]|uniref:DUF2188 domain-containing protein n=1 Tax=Mycobacterium lentiflavum TaxID=141349 RepID=A0A0E3WE46_MYCLN|nr:hypothetical protein [Mycobacterium lentiflavum]CQD23030.1 hypothetical protein BN1232_05838 [Mycobacterium lentiflavum]